MTEFKKHTKRDCNSCISTKYKVLKLSVNIPTANSGTNRSVRQRHCTTQHVHIYLQHTASLCSQKFIGSIVWVGYFTQGR